MVESVMGFRSAIGLAGVSAAFIAAGCQWTDAGTSTSSGTSSGAAAAAGGCAMTVHVLAPDARFASTDFRAGAALFFSRIDTATMAARLEDVPPGRALDATALFLGQDSRWRLLRPLPVTDDPDALVETPAQVQYLVRPVPGAAYVQLVLVGLPDAGTGLVAWPALAGRLGPPAGTAAGQIFTIQPDEPETCALDPDAAAAQTQGLLARHLNLKPRD
ncbi:MAG: hypothetical protein ACK5MY_18945 [Jhaorihella sp.]